MIGWTIAGALVPGAGLLAAGRKVWGWLLLGLALALGVGAAAFVLTASSPLDAVVRLAGVALDPTTLLVVTGAIIAAGLLWVVVILATHAALRRGSVLTGGQRVMATALVAALAGLVAVPTAYAGNLALVQRSLITSVFSNDEGGGSPGEGPQSGEDNPWASMPRVNVLLIGSDAGSDREGVRTDSLILVSIDTTTGDAVMFSLPRNLERVPFPLGTDGAQAWPDGFWCPENACMINAVWEWASTNEGGYYADTDTPGLDATRDAVEGVLGLRVDQYALVDLKGFQKVVDALGGIRIDVERDIPIGGGKTLSGYQNPIKGYITAGQNKLLDGYQALWYARSRDGSNDYDRMARQRCVIGAIIDRADPLTVLRAYPQLVDAAKEDIGTDVRQGDLQAWVKLLLTVKDGSVRSLPFDDKVVENRSDPDFEKIRMLVQESLLPPVDTPATTTPTTSPATPTGKPTDSPTDLATDPATDPSAAPTATYDPEQAQDLSAVC